MNDDFFAIYENKFIATLVRRLFIFVEKRYQYIIHQATLRDVELLYFKNKTNIEGSEIEIETRVRYSKPALDSAADRMKDFLRRIEDVRKYLRFFANSEFMRILHRERDVRNPILQTNIIRKNPKYRNCYHLWQFLNSYMESGLEVKVEEHFSQLSQKDLDEINKVLTINFLALKGRDAPKENTGKPKVYRPRILKTYDDEVFNPGRNNEGPIEFVRVDDKYREYQESLHNLTNHPTKAYAEYMKDEYAENKARREETKQKDALIKRKEAEYEKYKKEQELLLKKEEEDLQMVSDLAEQQIIEEQEEKLQPYRDALAKQGKKDKGLPKKEEEKSEEPKEKKKRGGARPGAGRKPKPKPEPEPVVEEEKPVVEELPPEVVEEIPPEEPKVVEEPKQEEQPVKKGRGGYRPGAGRKKKEQPVEETPKKQRGGARPGAGRKKKVQPEPEPVVEEKPVVVEEPVKEPEPVKEEPSVEKKKRGGARPGAGRKPKPKEEAKPVEKPKVEEVKPEPKPEPVVAPKPQSKKEKRLARKAEREEKQARILNVNASRRGKKFGRR